MIQPAPDSSGDQIQSSLGELVSSPSERGGRGESNGVSPDRNGSKSKLDEAPNYVLAEWKTSYVSDAIQAATERDYIVTKRSVMQQGLYHDYFIHFSKDTLPTLKDKLQEVKKDMMLRMHLDIPNLELKLEQFANLSLPVRQYPLVDKTCSEYTTSLHLNLFIEKLKLAHDNYRLLSGLL